MEKTSPPQLKSPPPGSNAPASARVPPVTPADIPGLGPIRVRALQKAGLDSLAALRAATLEDLLAVPGMSEIKARHIQTYLAQYSAPSAAAPSAKPKKAEPKPKPAAPEVAKPKSLPEPAEAAPKEVLHVALARCAELAKSAALAPARKTPLFLAVTQTMTHLLALVSEEPGAPLRPRLVRVMSRFPVILTKYLMELNDALSAKARERVIRLFRQINSLLYAAVTQRELDHKAQGRLADELEKLREKL